MGECIYSFSAIKTLYFLLLSLCFLSLGRIGSYNEHCDLGLIVREETWQRLEFGPFSEEFRTPVFAVLGSRYVVEDHLSWSWFHVVGCKRRRSIPASVWHYWFSYAERCEVLVEDTAALGKQDNPCVFKRRVVTRITESV